jgi:hypothetical protein
MKLGFSLKLAQKLKEELKWNILFMMLIKKEIHFIV